MGFKHLGRWGREPASSLRWKILNRGWHAYVNFQSGQSITSTPSLQLALPTIPHGRGWPSLCTMSKIEASPSHLLHRVTTRELPSPLDNDKDSDKKHSLTNYLVHFEEARTWSNSLFPYRLALTLDLEQHWLNLLVTGETTLNLEGSPWNSQKP